MDDKIQHKLDDLFEEYSEIFRKEQVLVHGYECQLRLQTEEPVFQRPYPVPIAQQQAVAEEIDRMLKMDIIEKSRSPYPIPVVPVF